LRGLAARRLPAKGSRVLLEWDDPLRIISHRREPVKHSRSEQYEKYESEFCPQIVRIVHAGDSRCTSCSSKTALLTSSKEAARRYGLMKIGYKYVDRRSSMMLHCCIP